MDHCEELNWNIDHLRNLQKIIVCCLSECISSSLLVKKEKEPGTFTCNLINYSIHTFFLEDKISRNRANLFSLFTLCYGFSLRLLESRSGRKRANPATPTSLFDSGYRIPRFVRKLNGYIIFWKGHSTLLPWRTRATGVEKRRGTCLLRCQTSKIISEITVRQQPTVPEIRQIEFTEFINRPFRFYYFNLDK